MPQSPLDAWEIRRAADGGTGLLLCNNVASKWHGESAGGPGSRRARGGRRGGFTLIELLVVVAVVALLIGVLLPALGAARRSARTAVCLSNMRQLAMAQVMYAGDHDGRLVRYGMAHGGAPLDFERSWFVTLQRYTDEPLTVRSPLDDSPFWPVDEGGLSEVVTGSGVDGRRATSYGLNDVVTGAPVISPSGQVLEFSRIDRIAQPARTVQWVMMAFRSELGFFGQFAVSDHVHPLEWWIESSPESGLVIAAEMVQMSAVGGKQGDASARSNYAFLDGHAATHRFREVWESDERNWFDPRVAR